MVWDSVWETIFQSQSWGKYPGEDLIRFVARNFYNCPERSLIKILEVGCGPGANLWYLAREGFEVYGVDGSPTAIQLAQSRLDEECPRWQGHLTIGDVTALPFADEVFDAVIDNECLCCNSYDVAIDIYSEMFRVAKPGGKLFSRTFAKGSWGDGAGTPAGHNAWFCSEGILAGKGLTRFTSLEEIENLMPKWKVESIELITHTRGGMAYEIKEWIIEGVRP
jgi:SAM-dependent methyltransferase